VSTEIDELHDAMFGFRPAKEGTAYERLAAVVLATLGWQDVAHDQREQGAGRRATHQLDVIGRHPGGEVQHLIVECKDWNKTVGKTTLDALAGVRRQIGADGAAVMTTQGYSAGAIAVAADEDIALLRLRHFDPDKPEHYVKRISLTIVAAASSYSDVNVEIAANRLPAGTALQAQVPTSDRLSHLDGTPAETLKEVLEGNGAKIDAEAGPYERHVSFSGGRLLNVGDGPPLQIDGLSWTETVHRSPHTTVREAQGEPLLVLEQLDEHGDLDSGRMVVDRDLFAWDIDADGNVRPRGVLIDDDTGL
jgi:restriction endonuclease